MCIFFRYNLSGVLIRMLLRRNACAAMRSYFSELFSLAPSSPAGKILNQNVTTTKNAKQKRKFNYFVADIWMLTLGDISVRSFITASDSSGMQELNSFFCLYKVWGGGEIITISLYFFGDDTRHKRKDSVWPFRLRACVTSRTNGVIKWLRGRWKIRVFTSILIAGKYFENYSTQQAGN